MNHLHSCFRSIRPCLEALDDRIVPAQLAQNLQALGISSQLAQSYESSGQALAVLSKSADIVGLERMGFPADFVASVIAGGFQASPLLAQSDTVFRLEALGLSPGSAVSAVFSNQASSLLAHGSEFLQLRSLGFSESISMQFAASPVTGPFLQRTDLVVPRLMGLGFSAQDAMNVISAGVAPAWLAHAGEILQLEALGLPFSTAATKALVTGDAAEIVAHAGEIRLLETVGFTPSTAITQVHFGNTNPIVQADNQLQQFKALGLSPDEATTAIRNGTASPILSHYVQILLLEAQGQSPVQAVNYVLNGIGGPGQPPPGTFTTYAAQAAGVIHDVPAHAGGATGTYNHNLSGTVTFRITGDGSVSNPFRGTLMIAGVDRPARTSGNPNVFPLFPPASPLVSSDATITSALRQITVLHGSGPGFDFSFNGFVGPSGNIVGTLTITLSIGGSTQIGIVANRVG